MAIQLVPWCDDARRMLERVPGIDVGGLEKEWRLNRASQLWEFTDERGRAGYAFTRLERTGPWYEWVWLAGAGRDLQKFVPVFAQVALDSGIPVRTYVQRRGLVRMYQRLGFRVSEYVMRRSY